MKKLLLWIGCVLGLSILLVGGVLAYSSFKVYEMNVVVVGKDLGIYSDPDYTQPMSDNVGWLVKRGWTNSYPFYIQNNSSENATFYVTLEGAGEPWMTATVASSGNQTIEPGQRFVLLVDVYVEPFAMLGNLTSFRIKVTQN